MCMTLQQSIVLYFVAGFVSTWDNVCSLERWTLHADTRFLKPYGEIWFFINLVYYQYFIEDMIRNEIIPGKYLSNIFKYTVLRNVYM